MKKVLILDDDKSILEMMQEVLKYSNYLVDITQSTEELFARLTHSAPDVLLIDYMLNGMNGGEVCQRIKQCDSTRNLPVIMVSAYANQHDFTSEYGCDATISKPLSLDELLEKVEKCLSKNHSQLYGN